MFDRVPVPNRMAFVQRSNWQPTGTRSTRRCAATPAREQNALPSQNPIADVHAAFTRRLGGSVLALAKALIGFGLPRRQPTGEGGGSTPAAPAETPAVAFAEAPPPAGYPTLADDPALEAIRARVAAMEARVIDLETRKAEMEQLLDEYAFCQYRALGDLLGEHLRLQHEVLQRRAQRSSRPEDQEAAAAAGEYEAYRQARAAPAAPQPALADSERGELKALYRAAAMRCHPDRVGEGEKARAHALFLRTQDAYRRRDLEAMRLIGQQLAVTAIPSAADDGSTTRECLETLLERLLDKGVELLLAIQSMQMQAQYRQARHREQWEDHFLLARQRLEDDCAALRRQLSRC